MPEYLPRIVDDELTLRLEAFGATLIVGPKWCGKTTTGEQKAKSILRMQDPDRRDGYAGSVGCCPHGCGSAAGGRTVYLDGIDVGRQQQDHALRNGTYLADENVSNEFI